MAQLNFDATAVAPAQDPEQIDPISLLIDIDNEDPSEESILQYLHALHAHAYARGEQCLPVERFYDQGALAVWHAAWADRPQDVQIPPQADLLHIRLLLTNALTPFRDPASGQDVVTFVDRVRRAHAALSAWLSSTESESPQQKRARQNREAQQRYRARMDPNDNSPRAQHARAVKAAYDKYLEACRQRREAMQQWAQYVDDQKKAWESLKNQTPQ